RAAGWRGAARGGRCHPPARADYGRRQRPVDERAAHGLALRGRAAPLLRRDRDPAARAARSAAGGDARTAHEPRMNEFGINLGFAIKRWPQPEEWAAVVREQLELDLVQFSFDLLDPWWPEHRRLAARAKAAADEHGIRVHSAQVGLAKYTYNGLLHPDPDARAASVEWWRMAIDVAVELGCEAMGGPLGAITVPEAARPGVRERRYDELLETMARL